MYVNSNLSQSVFSSDLLNEQYNVGEIVTLLTDAGLFLTIIVLVLHVLKKIYLSQNGRDSASIPHDLSFECQHEDIPDEHGCKLHHTTPA